MSQNITGTFAGSAGATSRNQLSATLVIPSGVTTARLNLSGQIDTNNRVTTMKSTNNGYSWTAQATYNAAQTNVAITVAHGEHWQFLAFTAEAGKVVNYSLSVES